MTNPLLQFSNIPTKMVLILHEYEVKGEIICLWNIKQGPGVLEISYVGGQTTRVLMKNSNLKQF